MTNKDQTKIEMLRTKWESEKNSTKENETPPTDVFKKSNSEVHLKRFSLFLSDGKSISIPYSSQPIIQATKNKIEIFGMGWKVIIIGRNLSEIDTALQNEQLQWIKENLTGYDDPIQSIFIKSIIIEGKLFE